MTRHALRLALADATAVLEQAGVASARVDAELIAAHVLGVERTRLGLVPLVDADVVDQVKELVEQRAQRIPLQHIVGTAPMGMIDLEVGPGVFVPRPETELLLAWALAFLEGSAGHAPVVLDLCTGSGALALAIAHARPDAQVHAVEIDASALAWARRNAGLREDEGDTPITLYQGDVTDRGLLSKLDGSVDLIVSNPPYIPEGADLEREVFDHDPHLALFAGADGLSVIKPMVMNVARWLRIGGAVGIEHDDTNGSDTAALFTSRRVFGDVVEHPDLAGRPRFVVAHRVATEVEAERIADAHQRQQRQEWQQLVRESAQQTVEGTPIPTTPASETTGEPAAVVGAVETDASKSAVIETAVVETAVVEPAVVEPAAVEPEAAVEAGPVVEAESDTPSDDSDVHQSERMTP